MGRPKKDPKPCTITIRLTETDKDEFLDFCRRTNLTQSDAFRLLLDQTEEAGTGRHLSAFFKESTDRIRQLEEENRTLPEKLLTSAVRKGYIDRIRFYQRGISRYLRLFFPRDWDGIPLPSLSFNLYEIYFKPFCDHVYPETEGYAVVQLEHLIWGKTYGAALFVLALTEDGARIRLRHYPKDDFVGFSLHRNPYAYRGARWFVGYRPAKDGAMDLIMAMPMDRPPVDTQTEMIETLSDIPSTRSLSLDERIAEIQNRRQQ